MTATGVIEEYLRLIADPGADIARVGELLTEDFLFVERPNLFSPNGTERDRGVALASLERGRALVDDQHFEVVDHLVGGDRVVTRVIWTGAMNGERLRAYSSMHFDLRDGRIARQENFDCFDPREPRGEVTS